MKSKKTTQTFKEKEVEKKLKLVMKNREKIWKLKQKIDALYGEIIVDLDVDWRDQFFQQTLFDICFNDNLSELDTVKSLLER